MLPSLLMIIVIEATHQEMVTHFQCYNIDDHVFRNKLSMNEIVYSITILIITEIGKSYHIEDHGNKNITTKDEVNLFFVP